MKILQISKPVLPISPEMKYGGIERVIRDLDQEYVKMGHDSFVVAPANSVIYGTLIPSNDKGAWTKTDNISYDQVQKERAVEIHAKKTLEAIEEIRPDAIHDHLPLIMHPTYLESGISFPMLTTLHGSLHAENGMSSIPNPTPKVVGIHNHFNSISESQRKFFSEVLPVGFNVYNAIPVEEYPYEVEKRDFLLSLGKIGINKGQDTAIATARRLGEKLVIAGPVHGFRGPIKDYWDYSVKPHIDETYLDLSVEEIDSFTSDLKERKVGKDGLVVYVGEVNDEQKKMWFKYSKGFLMPIRWHEPFGLVMIESMATGTPVVAYNMGAVPEIVVNGRTGYIVPENNFELFVEAVSKISNLDPEYSRRHIKNNFDISLQASRYLDIFEKIR